MDSETKGYAHLYSGIAVILCIYCPPFRSYSTSSLPVEGTSMPSVRKVLRDTEKSTPGKIHGTSPGEYTVFWLMLSRLMYLNWVAAPDGIGSLGVVTLFFVFLGKPLAPLMTA